MGAATLQFVEPVLVQLRLAVLLRDAYTGKQDLEGEVRVQVAGVEEAYRKPLESTYLFLNLGPGAHTVEVESLLSPPVYLPVSFSVTLPASDPLWPAYPDRAVADPTKPFDDPTQPPGFRAQFLNSSLLPSAQYPFPQDATLIRGTVSDINGPLDQATVSVGGEKRYVTDGSGEYVVFLRSYQPAATVLFERAGYTSQNIPIALQPHTTTIWNVLMTP